MAAECGDNTTPQERHKERKTRDGVSGSARVCADRAHSHPAGRRSAKNVRRCIWKKKKKSGQIPFRMSRWGAWGGWQHPGRGWGKWVGQPDTFHDPSSSLAFLQLSTTRHPPPPPPPPPPSILSAFCPPGWMIILFVLMVVVRPGRTGSVRDHWVSDSPRLPSLVILQTKTKTNWRCMLVGDTLKVLLLVFNNPFPLTAPLHPLSVSGNG